MLSRREEKADGTFCCDKKLARAEAGKKKPSYAAQHLSTCLCSHLQSGIGLRSTNLWLSWLPLLERSRMEEAGFAPQ